MKIQPGDDVTPPDTSCMYTDRSSHVITDVTLSHQALTLEQSDVILQLIMQRPKPISPPGCGKVTEVKGVEINRCSCRTVYIVQFIKVKFIMVKVKVQRKGSFISRNSRDWVSGGQQERPRRRFCPSVSALQLPRRRFSPSVSALQLPRRCFSPSGSALQ